MTLDQLRRFFATEFPQSTVVIDAVDAGTARVRQAVDDGHLRPGGTVSGPVTALIRSRARASPTRFRRDAS